MALSAVDSSKTQAPRIGMSSLWTFRRYGPHAAIGDRVKRAGGTGPGINAGASCLHRLEIVL